MSDDDWALFVLVVLVVDAIVILIAAWQLYGPQPQLYGGGWA